MIVRAYRRFKAWQKSVDDRTERLAGRIKQLEDGAEPRVFNLSKRLAFLGCDRRKDDERPVGLFEEDIDASFELITHARLDFAEPEEMRLSEERIPPGYQAPDRLWGLPLHVDPDLPSNMVKVRTPRRDYVFFIR